MLCLALAPRLVPASARPRYGIALCRQVEAHDKHVLVKEAAELLPKDPPSEPLQFTFYRENSVRVPSR